MASWLKEYDTWVQSETSLKFWIYNNRLNISRFSCCCWRWCLCLGFLSPSQLLLHLGKVVLELFVPEGGVVKFFDWSVMEASLIVTHYALFPDCGRLILIFTTFFTCEISAFPHIPESLCYSQWSPLFSLSYGYLPVYLQTSQPVCVYKPIKSEDRFKQASSLL